MTWFSVWGYVHTSHDAQGIRMQIDTRLLQQGRFRKRSIHQFSCAVQSALTTRPREEYQHDVNMFSATETLHAVRNIAYSLAQFIVKQSHA